MLILARKEGESIVIGNGDIKVTVRAIDTESGRAYIDVAAKDGANCSIVLDPPQEDKGGRT